MPLYDLHNRVRSYLDRYLAGIFSRTRLVNDIIDAVGVFVLSPVTYAEVQRFLLFVRVMKTSSNSKTFPSTMDSAIKSTLGVVMIVLTSVEREQQRVAGITRRLPSTATHRRVHPEQRPNWSVQPREHPQVRNDRSKLTWNNAIGTNPCGEIPLADK